jgi:hypothetical protein
MPEDDFLAGMKSLPSTLEPTPEWRARAEARKQRAQDELDRLYASKTASSTEIKQANKEWEFADDDLDFGPYPDSPSLIQKS